MRWNTSKRQDVKYLAQRMLPHLKVKRAQAELALEFYAWRETLGRHLGDEGIEVAQNFRKRFMALNVRGKEAKEVYEIQGG